MLLSWMYESKTLCQEVLCVGIRRYSAGIKGGAQRCCWRAGLDVPNIPNISLQVLVFLVS